MTRTRPPRTCAGVFESVYDLVRQVPAGRVTTYGDVSRAILGHSRAARTVGWALHALPGGSAVDVPWWRVISSRGVVSTSCATHSALEQQVRLEDEGVAFDAAGRVDLDLYAWDFGTAASPSDRQPPLPDRRPGATAHPS